MRSSKRERLNAAGWRVGSAEDFLELSTEEAAFVDLRLSLSQALKEKGLTIIFPSRRLQGSWAPVSPGLPKWRRRTPPCRWICSSVRCFPLARHGETSRWRFSVRRPAHS